MLENISLQGNVIEIVSALNRNDILELKRLIRDYEFKTYVNIPYKKNALTPIWYIKKNNSEFNEQILDILVDNDAIIDILNHEDQTLLMYCIERGYNRMAYSLLRNGCIVDIQDNSGMTALHYAVYNLDVDMVKILLKCEIDKNIKDNTGCTALDYIINGVNHQHIDDVKRKRRECFNILK
jgi:ankyrin repeat protein